MDQKPDSFEQWLLDGICDKCRRAKFCRKICGVRKRKKRATLAVLEGVIASKITHGISDVLGMY